MHYLTLYWTIYNVISRLLESDIADPIVPKQFSKTVGYIVIHYKIMIFNVLFKMIWFYVRIEYSYFYTIFPHKSKLAILSAYRTVKAVYVPCVPLIWASLTWTWWFVMCLELISAKYHVALICCFDAKWLTGDQKIIMLLFIIA